MTMFSVLTRQMLSGDMSAASGYMVSTNTLTSPTRSVDFRVVVVSGPRNRTRSDGVSASGGRVGGTSSSTGVGGGGVVLSESENHCECLELI
jgi:hypothetical protein